MKWVSHKATALSAWWVFFRPDLTLLAAAAAGSVFPDLVERYLFLRHRGMSHWIVWYLFIFTAAFMISNRHIVAFSTGCILHLAGDLLTPSGIPLSPGVNAGLGLFRTGSAAEALFVSVLIIITFLFSR